MTDIVPRVLGLWIENWSQNRSRRELCWYWNDSERLSLDRRADVHTPCLFIESFQLLGYTSENGLLLAVWIYWLLCLNAGARFSSLHCLNYLFLFQVKLNHFSCCVKVTMHVFSFDFFSPTFRQNIDFFLESVFDCVCCLALLKTHCSQITAQSAQRNSSSCRLCSHIIAAINQDTPAKIFFYAVCHLN